MYLTKSFNEQNTCNVPWDSLRYLIDSFDRRTLNTYLNEYLGDFLFDSFQPFYFSRSSGFDYKIPEPNNNNNYKNMKLSQFIESINQLPIENGPEVFGLHSNAEIGYYSTNLLWKNLINLQPRTQSGGNGGIRREDYISNIAKSIQNKIPESFDILIIRKKIESYLSSNNKHLQPTSVVLLQELERWNKLVQIINQSLYDLRRALIGEIGMSSELDSLSSDLYNGYLPNLWRKYAPNTLKKIRFMDDSFSIKI